MGAVLASVGIVAAAICAAAAFISHARPDAALGALALLVGQGDLLDQGRLSEADEERLMAMIIGARWPLTALVFGCAFVAGATMALWVG